MASLLPPKKKDWTPGTYQIGFFMRTPEGGQIEMTRKNTSKACVDAILAALRLDADAETNGRGSIPLPKT